MAQDTTLHIKVESEVAAGLKDLARRRKRTVSELVRNAISAFYQPALLGLTDKQRQAVEAYRGGYISLGKLAEQLGMSSIDARHWLTDHGIQQSTSFSRDDVDNA
jgi:predicted transcriptional regulator